jgi:hypothetical protein
MAPLLVRVTTIGNPAENTVIRLATFTTTAATADANNAVRIIAGRHCTLVLSAGKSRTDTGRG